LSHLRRGFALLLQLVALAHRFFDALLSLPGRTLARGTLPPRELFSVLLGKLPERFNLLSSLRPCWKGRYIIL
jgi:hypothetical protein